MARRLTRAHLYGAPLEQPTHFAGGGRASRAVEGRPAGPPRVSQPAPPGAQGAGRRSAAARGAVARRGGALEPAGARWRWALCVASGGRPVPSPRLPSPPLVFCLATFFFPFL
jgi:hypothetical protein